ncbi:VID27-domain-containing protein [Meredithblackwellia eburnea MCA 4105]
MFLVNRLFGLNGPSPAPELLTIDNGRLFLVRPDSIKGSRECIFIDASISIRRTTHEFNYQLVVTRTFQDGEEQLLEEDAENSDERAFLLDSSLYLSLGPTLDTERDALPGQPQPLSFTWLDPDGDGPDDEFEFTLSHSDSHQSDTPALFERLAWRCMWERREKRAWPTDEKEAAAIEQSLEDDFKVERSVLETLNAATPQPGRTPSKAHQQSSSKSKTPLFRPPTDDEDSDADESLAPRSSKGKSAVADEDGSSDDDDDDDDDGAELAAQLTGKLNLGSSSTPSSKKASVATSSSKGTSPVAASKSAKGKGKAKKEESPPAATEGLPIAPPLERPPTQVAPAGIAGETPMVLRRGTAYIHDQATGLFMEQDKDCDISLHRLVSGKVEGFWLTVAGKETLWCSQGIELDSSIGCYPNELSVVFNCYNGDYPSASDSEGEHREEDFSKVWTWCVKFESLDDFSAFQLGVSEALYELKWGPGSWKKLKEDEKDYQKTAYIEDQEMYDIPENEHQEQEVPEEDESEEEESEEEEDSEDERDRGSKQKNSNLAVGYKDGLSFVTQGDRMGVFRHQEGGKKMKFVTSIAGISDGKRNFAPDKMMLHQQDTTMILRNPTNRGALWGLDLETGKVVNEYKISEDFDVVNFVPDSKFAQTTMENTFVGIGSNNIFRIDPRLSGSKVVESEFKQYASKQKFSVAATTDSRRLAVASDKGEIRLFDKIGKIAKTVLPALGDPIIGLDVSADGRWVLATCKTYLLLIDAQIPEGAGRYGGSSGFDRSFPATAKPTPKRLQLKPEHVALMEQESKTGVFFGPATFNKNPGQLEKTIVAPTGPFLVAWNFRQVKAGRTDNYTLRRFSDTVIADNFKFGGDNQIITVLPQNIIIEDKKKLKAPTRDSISGIVRTWDGR